MMTISPALGGSENFLIVRRMILRGVLKQRKGSDFFDHTLRGRTARLNRSCCDNAPPEDTLVQRRDAALVELMRLKAEFGL